MPRKSREKIENGIYHIMVRSIKEVILFKDSKDKTKYLNLIKEGMVAFNFKVYCYCLMNNHGHLVIDANGADISKIMHNINFRYVSYFNKRYKRHGHLFQDRFKSKLIEDEKYLLEVSAYIHKNPMSIKKFKESPEKFKFSSLAIYMGLKKDDLGIVNSEFIIKFFHNNFKKAREKYYEYVFKNNKECLRNIDKFNFNNEKTEYKSLRTILKRDFSEKDVMSYLCNKINIKKENFYLKNNKKYTNARKILIVLLKNFCGKSCREICETIGNITQSRVSSLCTDGIKLILEDNFYKNIFNDFLKA